MAYCRRPLNLIIFWVTCWAVIVTAWYLCIYPFLKLTFYKKSWERTIYGFDKNGTKCDPFYQCCPCDLDKIADNPCCECEGGDCMNMVLERPRVYPKDSRKDENKGNKQLVQQKTLLVQAIKKPAISFCLTTFCEVNAYQYLIVIFLVFITLATAICNVFSGAVYFCTEQIQQRTEHSQRRYHKLHIVPHEERQLQAKAITEVDEHYEDTFNCTELTTFFDPDKWGVPTRV